MPSTADAIPVVAAVVASEDGRFLVGLRPEHKRHGGLWEFPGGKRSAGESDEQAMARELQEELAVGLHRFGALMFETRDPGSTFVIRFFEVELDGTPSASEHSQIGWFTPATLRTMKLAPSDARFVEAALFS